MVLEGLLEGADDAIAFGGGRVNRHQIVVVEIDAPGAELAQAFDGNDRVDRRPDDLAEGVATAVADGPEAEGELVRSGGGVSVSLHAHMIVSAQGSRSQLRTFGANEPYGDITPSDWSQPSSRH